MVSNYSNRLYRFQTVKSIIYEEFLYFKSNENIINKAFRINHDNLCDWIKLKSHIDIDTVFSSIKIRVGADVKN